MRHGGTGMILLPSFQAQHAMKTLLPLNPQMADGKVFSSPHRSPSYLMFSYSFEADSRGGIMIIFKIL